MLESYECFQIEFLVFSCYNSSTGLSGNLFPGYVLITYYKTGNK